MSPHDALHRGCGPVASVWDMTVMGISGTRSIFEQTPGWRGINVLTPHNLADRFLGK